MYSKICVVLLFWTSLNHIKGERLSEQIYAPIQSALACFRRLNATHQAGCTSPQSGNVGIVQMIESEEDARWIVSESTAGPYVAVVDTNLFQKIIPILVEKPNNVAGVLLHKSSERSYFLSDETECPNEFFSAPGSECRSNSRNRIPWNPYGSGLLRMEIPFPIFILPIENTTEIDDIRKCAKRFNSDRDNHVGRPLCSLQLTAFQFAAVNSDVCLRRSANSLIRPNRMCDPLGDNNIYYSLFPRSTELESSNQTVTMVSARIDTATLYDNLAPGTVSSVVGLVTILTAAATLSKMLPMSEAKKYNHNILWTLFHGEAFDYIGSQSVAYDIKQGNWPPNAPLDLSQFKMHVEIGQIGAVLNTDEAKWDWYAYMPTGQESMEFVEMLNKNLYKNMTLEKQVTLDLPPSSLHSFRRILKNETENGDIKQVLLTDFSNSFKNKYYHSILDDDKNILYEYRNITVDSNGTFIDTDTLIANNTMTNNDTQVKIALFATSLAKTLYKQVTNEDYEGNIKASAHLVDEMLNCYMKTQACRLLIASDFADPGTDPENLPTVPPSLYVGVSSWSATAGLFTGHLLALLTGDHLELNKTACDTAKDVDFTYYWMKGWNSSGVCVRTTMNFTKAISPAFTIPGYNLTSGEYSTWTESVWDTMGVRMFVAAGGGGSTMASIIGVITTLTAALTTFWVKKHCQLIFPQPPPTNVVQINSDVTTGILRTVNC